ncbi:DDE-type integrase/transposase/recombinase [Pseudomonas yamanorum]|uniref:Mu transposase C-terminal domain-containing protein n=1 Tax=Pseudomonas yamanorum TaxID=515393 RepID=UPI001C43AFBE|nr:Mu transposase C-terminal domain-containing protein [Pseudomonas yamanorum]MBV6659808.1 DDE-type integrase/transposase/recombinase [Pseudomonas yamanorum]
MAIARGDAFIYEGRKCIYEASLEDGCVLLYDESSQVFIQAKVGSLEPYDTSYIAQEDFTPAAERASEEEWNIAAHRYEEIGRYIESERAPEDLSKLCEKLKVGVKRCYALISDYDSAEGPEDFLRNKAGRKIGAKLLTSQLEKVIASAINEKWKGPGANYAVVIRRVDELCEALSLKAPAKQTVINRIKIRSEYELLKLKEGAKKANDKFQPRVKKNRALKPLDKTEMDHCLIDCIIVDEITRKPLCRPWVTLIIDLYSRVVLGFYLSVHAPSSYSVSMAVTNATFPKDPWLETLGAEDIRYPYYGRPYSILMDNAREFRSKTARIAAKKHQIKWHFRPKHMPWWGGHIERLFGTLQVGAVQFLPGATLSNVVLRGDYDSEKEACFTFNEFREWFIRNLQIYHNTVHSVLDATPHEQWAKGWVDEEGKNTHPNLLSNPIEFSIDFFPERERTITRQGIEMFGLQYWSGVLTPYVGKKYFIKFNPLSLRHVWINPSGARYLKVPYQDITQPDISLEELNLAKKQRASERGKRPSNSRANRQEYFSLVAKNREKVEDAKAATKGLHKMRENRKNSDFAQQAVLGREPALDVKDEDDKYETVITTFHLDLGDD